MNLELVKEASKKAKFTEEQTRTIVGIFEAGYVGGLDLSLKSFPTVSQNIFNMDLNEVMKSGDEHQYILESSLDSLKIFESLAGLVFAANAIFDGNSVEEAKSDLKLAVEDYKNTTDSSEKLSLFGSLIIMASEIVSGIVEDKNLLIKHLDIATSISNVSDGDQNALAALLFEYLMPINCILLLVVRFYKDASQEDNTPLEDLDSENIRKEFLDFVFHTKEEVGELQGDLSTMVVDHLFAHFFKGDAKGLSDRLDKAIMEIIEG